MRVEMMVTHFFCDNYGQFSPMEGWNCGCQHDGHDGDDGHNGQLGEVIEEDVAHIMLVINTCTILTIY